MRFQHLLSALRVLCLLMATAVQAPAQGLTALARLDAGASTVTRSGEGVAFVLTLTQPVPWRLRFLDAPPRLVIDTREVDWTGIASLALPETVLAGVWRAISTSLLPMPSTPPFLNFTL